MVDCIHTSDKHPRGNSTPLLLNRQRGRVPVHISVDGSNVLFWRGGQKLPDIPEAVTRALIARRFAPVVYFDHSIHRHMAQERLGVLAALVPVVIAAKGTPADVLLLEAVQQGQIVSNDRYRDWRTQFPHLRNDTLVTGHISKGGRVCFSKKLRSAPL